MSLFLSIIFALRRYFKKTATHLVSLLTLILSRMVSAHCACARYRLSPTSGLDKLRHDQWGGRVKGEEAVISEQNKALTPDTLSQPSPNYDETLVVHSFRVCSENESTFALSRRSDLITHVPWPCSRSASRALYPPTLS